MCASACDKKDFPFPFVMALEWSKEKVGFLLVKKNESSRYAFISLLTLLSC